LKTSCGEVAKPASTARSTVADRDIALRHRVDLVVGTAKRSHQQGSAADGLRLAHRRNGDVEPLARLGECRKLGRDHDGRRILERRVDAGRKAEAEARGDALHALGRIFEAVVAGACEADYDAVARKLVGAKTLERAEVLNALRLGGSGKGEASGKRGGEKSDEFHAGRPQKGLTMEKKRCSQP
jgi:hypothetical protein